MRIFSWVGLRTTVRIIIRIIILVVNNPLDDFPFLRYFFFWFATNGGYFYETFAFCDQIYPFFKII